MPPTPPTTNPFGNINSFPRDFRIVDANGLLTPAWQYFLRNLWLNQLIIYPATFTWQGMPISGGRINIPIVNAGTSSFDKIFIAAADPPTVDAVFTLYKISNMAVFTLLGTITLTAGTHLASLEGPGGTLMQGDTLQIIAPDPQDVTLADVSITLSFGGS